jgi:hypothetical protein
MAYFPNGMSFADWSCQNCTDCVNYRDNGTGSFGCAITDAYFLFASKMHDKLCRRTPVFTTLDFFIPDDGPDAFKCRMRLTREDMETEERQRNYQLDLARYEAAMAETRQAA